MKPSHHWPSSPVTLKCIVQKAKVVFISVKQTEIYCSEFPTVLYFIGDIFIINFVTVENNNGTDCTQLLPSHQSSMKISRITTKLRLWLCLLSAVWGPGEGAAGKMLYMLQTVVEFWQQFYNTYFSTFCSFGLERLLCMLYLLRSCYIPTPQKW